jgi:fructoselysine-6-P-deglycase FrlB-like protein
LILNEVSMPFNPDSHLSAEIASQPSDWEAIAARQTEFATMLPSRGARVAILGSGTSYYMAQAYAARREFSGHGETDAFAASEHRLSRRYDAVLLLSRSGTTTEAIDVLTFLKGRGIPTTAIVATPGTPVSQLADHAIVLPEIDERSVVQTRFATSTLALLRASLGEDVAPAVEDARAVLSQDEADCLSGVVEAEQLTFLGRGWTIGLAEEAALKLRESAQFWTEAYPAMEYRHGPISIATAGRAVWALGEVPDGLAAQVAATGAHFEHRSIDPLAELVRVHRLCLRKARDKDLDPDHPRHLTRSVVLAPDAHQD